ncbi:MAG: hypothetical protein RL266_562 [Bacteroidota bacterium]|jgi:galactokinase
MDTLTQKFELLFGTPTPDKRYFCPGRVNLIGEHIDYLGGLVLPVAISMGISAIFRPNASRRLRIHSTDFDQTIVINLDELPSTKQGTWSDYVLGVLTHLSQKGVVLNGGDLLFSSNLPKSSGLSSSAALEVLCYFLFMDAQSESSIDRIQMARDCQQVENLFIGVSCGIMDQFAVANGKKGHATLLNCDSLESEVIPFKTGEYQLLIINSNKPRQLAHSAYNQRRAECSEALDALRIRQPELKSLVQADLAAIQHIKNDLPKKRARHAITEQQRVIESVAALRQNKLIEFGKLLNASHASLRDDFEVSCEELDLIVALLQSSDQCLGARMTGAGFGGCCIALVENSSVHRLSKELTHRYKERFGFAPSVFTCETSDGVHAVTS